MKIRYRTTTRRSPYRDIEPGECFRLGVNDYMRIEVPDTMVGHVRGQLADAHLLVVNLETGMICPLSLAPGAEVDVYVEAEVLL